MNRKNSHRSCIIPALLLIFAQVVAMAAPADPFDEARRKMVAEIQEDVDQTAHFIGRKTLDQQVMAAMAHVPRQEFVPSDMQSAAYENRPLPIGYGQTISQPYIVALMTDLLQPDPDDIVLEIGTGSGYQAAVLAELVKAVYTIEIIKPLALTAEERLQRLGYANIQVRFGDGYYGWEEKAPFDGIVVTAAADHIPPPLLQQLRPGGRMVIPVGSRFMVQQLLLVEKDLSGTFRTKQMLPVRFVPLTGGH